MKRPRISIAGLMILVALIAIDQAALLNLVGLTPSGVGQSPFGFESTFWDLGLLPILNGLGLGVLGKGRFRGRSRRFLLGFEVAGLGAVLAYGACCLPPAGRNPLSMFLPFESGIRLSPNPYGLRPVRVSYYCNTPGVSGLRRATSGGMVGDAGILAMLPLLVASMGGLLAWRKPEHRERPQPTREQAAPMSNHRLTSRRYPTTRAAATAWDRARSDRAYHLRTARHSS